MLTAGIIAAVSMTGCKTAVENPSSVTLINAMQQLGAGFAEMRKAEDGNRTGLIADTADVTFNISANSTDNKSLTVDLKGSAAPPQIPANVSADVAAALSHAYVSARGSQITIHFVNIMTMDPKKSMCQNLNDVAEAARLIGTSPNNGMDIFMFKGNLPNK